MRRAGALVVASLLFVAPVRAEPSKPLAQSLKGEAKTLYLAGVSQYRNKEYAAALAQFEASLRCSDDPYVRSLAFMASCSSQNSLKAKLYFKRLTPAQQTKFAQMCIRNGVEYQ